MDDLLALEGLVIARLKSKLTVPVLSAADLAEVNDLNQVAPAVHVLPQSPGPIDTQIFGESKQTPGIAKLEHVIYVVTVVRYLRTAEEARSEAGAIMWKCATSLLGWKPNRFLSWMQINIPPAPIYGKAYLYFPLSFSSTFTVKGEE